MRIVTERLVLRELSEKDIHPIALHAGKKSVSQFLLVVPHPYTKKHAKEFVMYARKKASAKPRTSYEFGIELKEVQGLIGVIGLTHVDSFQGTAGIGYWLAEPHWRKGYMTEAFAATLDFAFTKLKLRRINIEAFIENEASNGLIRKMGFTHEGTHRKKVRSKATGKIHDEHVYGLLREEWMKKRRVRPTKR